MTVPTPTDPVDPAQPILYASGRYDLGGRPGRVTAVGVIGLIWGLLSVAGNALTLPVTAYWWSASLTPPPVASVPTTTPVHEPALPPPYVRELVGPAGMTEFERDDVTQFLLARERIYAEQITALNRLLAEVGHDVFKSSPGKVSEPVISDALTELQVVAEPWDRERTRAKVTIVAAGGTVELDSYRASFRPHDGSGVWKIEAYLCIEPSGTRRLAWHVVDQGIQRLRRRFGNDFNSAMAGGVVDYMIRQDPQAVRDFGSDQARIAEAGALYLSNSSGHRLLVAPTGRVVSDHLYRSIDPATGLPPPQPLPIAAPPVPVLAPFIASSLLAVVLISLLTSCVLVAGSIGLLANWRSARAMVDGYCVIAIAVSVVMLVLATAAGDELLAVMHFPTDSEIRIALTIGNIVAAVVTAGIPFILMCTLHGPVANAFLGGGAAASAQSSAPRGVAALLAGAGLLLLVCQAGLWALEPSNVPLALRGTFIGLMGLGLGLLLFRRKRPAGAVRMVLVVALAAAAPAASAAESYDIKARRQAAELESAAKTDVGAATRLAALGAAGLPTLLDVIAASDEVYLEKSLRKIIDSLPAGVVVDDTMSDRIRPAVDALLRVIHASYTQKRGLTDGARAAGELLLRLGPSASDQAWEAVQQKTPSLGAEGEMFRTLAGNPKDAKALQAFDQYYYAHRRALMVGALRDKRPAVQAWAAGYYHLPFGDAAGRSVDARLVELATGPDAVVAAAARQAIGARQARLSSGREPAQVPSGRWIPDPPPATTPSAEPDAATATADDPAVNRAAQQTLRRLGETLQVLLIATITAFLAWRFAVTSRGATAGPPRPPPLRLPSR